MAVRPDDVSRKVFNQKVIEEFRANGGIVGGQLAQRPLVLLTTTGAKSGRPYTTPLAYSKEGAKLVVIASKAGAPNNPDWYHNLRAHPVVTVEVGVERYQAKATVVTGGERDRLYQRQAELMPIFAEYQTKTTRKIPVVVLERVG